MYLWLCEAIKTFPSNNNITNIIVKVAQRLKENNFFDEENNVVNLCMKKIIYNHLLYIPM